MARYNKEESRVFRDFEIQKVLGCGGFGFVLQVQHIMDLKKYALKLTLNNDRHTAKEVEHFAKIRPHENVVAYTTSWVDTLAFHEMKCLAAIGFSFRAMSIPYGIQRLQLLCIQMELCGQDLRHWLCDQTTVDDVKCKGIFQQMLNGLQHIHDQDLIHRDLKPDNIFFALDDPDKVKIGDFGIAAIHRDAAYIEHTKDIGTILYMAPEQSTPQYDKRVDLFAMGLILFEIYHPPAQKNLKNSIDSLRNHKKFPKEFKRTWPDVHRAILSLLQEDARNRPSIAELTKTFLDKPSESDKGPIGNLVGKFTIGKLKAEKVKAQLDEPIQPGQVKGRDVACIGCTQPIKGIRYKCNTCDDFNYCINCYKAAATHKSHHKFSEISKSSSELFSPLVSPDTIVHHGVECNGCEDIQIRGRRYKCQTCTNVNFCRKCYVSDVFHRMDHSFSVITLCAWHQGACKPPEYAEPDSNPLSRVEHLGVRCHKCKVGPITGVRYSCKSCPFVDYCDSCYMSWTKCHRKQHIFKEISKCAEHSVACHHCKKGIVGSRYKCVSCQNFDYCYACYCKSEKHRKIHEFYVFHESG